jgi:hypothetical protein
MTTMKTKLYTVLTVALLSTTVLSSAQGASVPSCSMLAQSYADIDRLGRHIVATDEGFSTDLEGISSMTTVLDLSASMLAQSYADIDRLGRHIVATDEGFSTDLEGISSMTTVLDLSAVTMNPTKTSLLLDKLYRLRFHQAPPVAAPGAAPAHVGSLDAIESVNVLFSDPGAAPAYVRNLDAIDGVHALSLDMIKFGTVSGADAISILSAVNPMGSVTNIEFVEPIVTNAHGLQALAALRRDLSITPGFAYKGPLDPLLARLQRGPMPLTTLDLKFNSIDADGARALAANLGSVPGLTTLDLGSNCIDADGATALAAALHHLPQLETLSLHTNDIFPRGATALATHLGSVPKLTTLSLWGSYIFAAGAEAIAANLGSVPGLIILELHESSMGAAGAAAVAAALHRVPLLTTLGLSQNHIDAAGATALATHLGSVPQLRTLLLGGNPIDAGGKAALAAAVVGRPGFVLFV